MVEAKTLGIDHRSQEVGRKTSSQKVKINCALRAILAVIVVEELL
jgi:hypothetical protein